MTAAAQQCRGCHGRDHRDPDNSALGVKRVKLAALFAAALSVIAPASARMGPSIPTAAAIDAEVARGMAATGARGLALAVIDKGRVVHVKSYGQRKRQGRSA